MQGRAQTNRWVKGSHGGKLANSLEKIATQVQYAGEILHDLRELRQGVRDRLTAFVQGIGRCIRAGHWPM